MDSMKSATGLSTDPSQKSGEEPLSGQKGEGTVEEPYDQGNAEGELSPHCLTDRLGGGLSLWIVLIGILVYVGSEGAPAKKGMTGVLDDTKRKAEELVGKGS